MVSSCRTTAASRGVASSQWSHHRKWRFLFLHSANSGSPPPPPSHHSVPAHIRTSSPYVTRGPPHPEPAPTSSDPGAGLLPTQPPLSFLTLLLLHPILGERWVLEPVPNGCRSQPKAEAGTAHSDQGPSGQDLTTICPVYPTPGLGLPPNTEATRNRK